jgi:hypothetical protein
LPWGTPEEEFIPAPLVFEAEMALAKAQLATQTPACETPIEPPRTSAPIEPPAFPSVTPSGESDSDAANDSENGAAPQSSSDEPNPGGTSEESVPVDAEPPAETQPSDETAAQYEAELPPGASSDSAPLPALQSAPAAAADTTGAIGAYGPHGTLPPDWPDERGFIPPPPSPSRPSCCPHNGPVMTHTRSFHGSDSEFTEALASYYHFRDDARFGGWQNYLQRSDDFIRFCCHLHISEMLSARGGAGETRVVWQWSDSR